MPIYVWRWPSFPAANYSCMPASWPGKTRPSCCRDGRLRKTHLVAELVKAGAAYFSDEYAVLDEDGWVHPFAKPLSVRSSKTAPQIETPVEEIGGVSGRKPVSVGLVAMSQFREGARWRPKRLTAGRGMLELLDNTFSARQAPERAIDILGRVASGATVMKGKRGDAAAMVSSIFAAVEAG
jgi:hypothetical protein